jgi:hypothetical protein
MLLQRRTATKFADIINKFYNVLTNTDFSSKTGTGLYPLFRFISGNNNTQTKVFMTPPVIMQETEIDGGVKRTMSFIISSSKFTSSDQLPRANDQNIQIGEESNSRDMVCIIHSIYQCQKKKNAAKEKELREAVARDDIQLSTNRSNVLYFGYK